LGSYYVVVAQDPRSDDRKPSAFTVFSSDRHCSAVSLSSTSGSTVLRTSTAPSTELTSTQDASEHRELRRQPSGCRALASSITDTSRTRRFTYSEGEPGGIQDRIRLVEIFVPDSSDERPELGRAQPQLA
jgi:hypothetical protein